MYTEALCLLAARPLDAVSKRTHFVSFTGVHAPATPAAQAVFSSLYIALGAFSRALEQVPVTSLVIQIDRCDVTHTVWRVRRSTSCLHFIWSWRRSTCCSSVTWLSTDPEWLSDEFLLVCFFSDEFFVRWLLIACRISRRWRPSCPAKFPYYTCKALSQCSDDNSICSTP